MNKRIILRVAYILICIYLLGNQLMKNSFHDYYGVFLAKFFPEQIRESHFSQTNYPDTAEGINSTISKLMKESKINSNGIPKIKSIIVPHASWKWSANILADTFKLINPEKDKEYKIFMIGPVHSRDIQSCSLSTFLQFKTPFGTVDTDQEIINQLRNEFDYDIIPQELEEQEHSLEMILPFVQYTFQESKFKIIPILCTEFNPTKRQIYAASLLKYFNQENTLFVISSDFCHWGTQYNYTKYDTKFGSINQYIEKLDSLAAFYIELHDSKEFQKYLWKTQNQICGKHAIDIFLNIVSQSKTKYETKLLRYGQSQKNTILINNKVIGMSSFVTYEKKSNTK